MEKKFYLTTPIYYVNAPPHLGHAYTTIAADALARFHRMNGEDVFFLVGTDENAQKNVESALKKREELEEGTKLPTRELVQKFVDLMSAKWQQTWDELNISNDDFIRTTQPRHIKYVEDFWRKVKANGDIYKATYEGLYCTACEEYKTESELVDGLCILHKIKPIILSEENYFFKLSKYKDQLLKHIEKHPEFIQPETRRNEVVAYIKDYARDFSISRKNLEWGIPVPDDKDQTIYVWFDALLNYVSAKPERWPADLHLVGKDIIKFHCAYWPAMLMSVGLPLPKTVFAHGFFTIDGQKMSKTIGNVIAPLELKDRFGVDATRYVLLAEIPFGHDGDISREKFDTRYEADLVNGLGNLTSRILTMASRQPVKFDYALAGDLETNIKKWWSDYGKQMESVQIGDALQTLVSAMRFFDQFAETHQPWKLAKSDPEKFQQIISVLLEALRHIAWMFLPFVPETSQQILTWLGVFDTEKKLPLAKIQKWGNLKGTKEFQKAQPLFPRLEKQVK